MNVLGIDTSTATTSVAVLAGDRVVEAIGAHDARGADLLVFVDRACRDAGVSAHELDAIAIGAGPGSFTGLRIGMATAKGIAFAASRPLWAVSSLAALAWAADSDQIVCAALDARRGEVYAGCYARERIVADDRVIAPTELAAWAHSHGARIFTGDALAAYADVLAALAPTWRAATPTGRAVAELALRGPRTDILALGTPTYLRKAEAEILYPDGVPGALRKR